MELATTLKRSNATQESVASGKAEDAETKLSEVERLLADTRSELCDAQQTSQSSMVGRCRLVSIDPGLIAFGFSH